MKRILYIIFLIVVIWIGFTLGRSSGKDVVFDAERDMLTEFPMPPPPPADEEILEIAGGGDQARMVVVEMPVKGAGVDDVLTVAGRAHSSIDNVLVTLKDADGELLYDEEEKVSGGGGDVYGRFETDIDMSSFEPGEIQVIVFGITKEGIEERDMRVVTLAPPDAVPVKVFFPNADISADANPEEDICTHVHPVMRTVSSKSAIYRSVLESLADGPTVDEREGGYTTSLPSDVVLRSVAADSGGIVIADFTSSLNRGVAGSCRVGSIRAQIEATLRQFPEVRGVVITVDGDADEALQP